MLWFICTPALLFFLPEVVNRAFVHLLEVLNSVGFLRVTKGFVSCWNLTKCKCVEKRISPETEGGWWLFKVSVFFSPLSLKQFFPFQTLDLCLGQNHVAVSRNPGGVQTFKPLPKCSGCLIIPCFSSKCGACSEASWIHLDSSLSRWWWTTQGCAEWTLLVAWVAYWVNSLVSPTVRYHWNPCFGLRLVNARLSLRQKWKYPL